LWERKKKGERKRKKRGLGPPKFATCGNRETEKRRKGGEVQKKRRKKKAPEKL